VTNWNFDDFLRRLEALKGMGSLEDLVRQVPGLGAILNEVDFKLGDLEPIERILRAMSAEERREPSLLDGEAGLERRQRIADGSGTSLDAVDSLIHQFKTLCRMLESMSAEDVTQELIEQVKPDLEDWQTSPDAWKDAAGELEGDDAAEVRDREAEEDEMLQILRRQLDLILAKVSASGMSSLNEAERALLDEASRRFRERQGS